MHRQIAGKLTSKTTKWVSLVAWIIVLAGASMLAPKLTDAQSNEASSWLPSDAESTRALDLQTAFQSENTFPAVIVYENPAGLTQDQLAKVQADAAEFAKFEDLDGEVIGPIPSDDGQAVQTIVPLDLGKNGWNKAPGIADDLRSIAENDAGDMTVHITGPLGGAADSAEAFEGIDGTLLFATLAVVIILLLLTYRSPVLWILPLFSAVAALFGAQAVIYLLAEHAGLVVNGQSAGILTVLVVGAGTDYALLLVARYREELREHEDRHEAMAVALHRAGPAIFASGGTVVLGMLVLLVAEMNSTKGLGPVAAIGIIVALLAMLTLLPALLVIFGRWVFWPRIPHYGSDEPTNNGLWAKIGRRIAGGPRATWVVTTLVLGIACLGVTQLDAHGLSNADAYTNTPQSIVGDEIRAQHGLVDESNPVAILTKPDFAAEVSEVAGNTDGIVEVAKPQVIGDVASISATLSDAPDSQAAFDTIKRLRDAVHEVDGADALVGGNTAIQLDIREAAARDNKVIIPLILLVVFFILMLLLRAVLAPVILIATVVLSFGAALGVSALVFKHGFGFDGADSAFPLFVFVFLVALGIDYNIFLMTRVREEAVKYGTRAGALIGLAATGGVITSAGLVLAGTFAVLGTLPVTFLAELGFAVAFGVLLDTIVVRSVLVTALNLDIGRHMWWPSALAKKEDVDVDEVPIEEQSLLR